MKIEIRVANEEDRFKVSQIRREAFLQSSYQIHDPVQLNWGPTDRLHRVLLLEVDGFPISTTRLDLTLDVGSIEYKLQCTKAILKVTDLEKFGVFCRGATLPQYQGRGFYQLLHLSGLQFFCKNQVDHVFRSFAYDPAIAQSLLEIGFDLVKSDQNWSDFISTEKETYVASLKGNQIKGAIQSLILKCHQRFEFLSLADNILASEY